MTDIEKDENGLPKVPKLKPVRPWDIFNTNKIKVPLEVHEKRMSICKSCPFFIKITGQCRKCGCFMEAKTTLADAFCPENKWGPEVIDQNKVSFKKEIDI